MSIAELTTKIESLSADDYNMIVMLIERLLSNADDVEKKTADDIVSELTTSMNMSNAGHTKSARSVSSKMREKYAV